MPHLDALKLAIASGVAAVVLAVGCSSTTQVKGSGKSGSGGDDGGSAGGAGTSAGEGGAAGDVGAGGAGASAGAGGAGSGGAGSGGAGGAGAGGAGAGGTSGSAGTGAGRGGVSGSGGAFGAGGSGAAGSTGAGGTGAAGGTGGASGNNGCAVVTCAGTSCCSGTAVFVLDTPLQNYRDRPDLVTRFSVTSTAAVAEFRFDASGQRGNIGFDLNRSTNVFALFVDADYSGAADYPYVGLETGGGARGCAYALVGTEADLSYPLFCWGTPAFALSETTRVNVRIDSNAVGPATLSISAVDVN